MYKPGTWKPVEQSAFQDGGCQNPPFALTQFALMLAYALRSMTSSTERSPTSSTLTMLALRGREREESFGEGETEAAAAAARSSAGGSLMVVGRLIVGEQVKRKDDEVMTARGKVRTRRKRLM